MRVRVRVRVRVETRVRVGVCEREREREREEEGAKTFQALGRVQMYDLSGEGLVKIVQRVD